MSKICTFKQANSRNNYLLVLKKKDFIQENVCASIEENEGKTQYKPSQNSVIECQDIAVIEAEYTEKKGSKCIPLKVPR